MIPIGERIRVWGPGSLSNLGPGFDTLGLCLEGVGDVVELWRTEEPGVHVVPGTGPWEPPADAARNTAATAALAVLRDHPGTGGLALTVTKGILPGSGLGSSAASAAAAAWGALNLLTDRPGKSSAVRAALEGEAVVAGAMHGDNVLPALLGGLVLTASSAPEEYRSIAVPEPLHLAVIRPHVEILTRVARAMLPERVALRDAVHNASALAFLVDALSCGDVDTVGRMIERDVLVEPVRATLLPGFGGIRRAAREAGAAGAALSGSGPAVFAVCRDRPSAGRVLDAMLEAARRAGHAVDGLVSGLDPAGTCITDRQSPPRTI